MDARLDHLGLGHIPIQPSAQFARHQGNHGGGRCSPAGTEPEITAGVLRRQAWYRHLRHYLRGLDHLGLALALVTFLLSLTPSLLPRPWTTQGVVWGLTAAAVYGVGVALTRIGRWAGVPPLPPVPHRRLHWAIGLVALVSVPIMLQLGAGWQDDVRQAVGMSGSERQHYLAAFLVGVGVFAGLVGLARLARDAYLAVHRPLRRRIPDLPARLIAAATVVALAVTLLDGALYHGLMLAADAVFSAADHATDPGTRPPSSSLRSGGPGSLVPWDSLGRQGRDFVASGPTPADIERLTGRRAQAPIRAYAGLGSASTLRGEADLVLRELERTRAFDRPVLAVATTTGTGWVDPELADPLEYEYGGDTAIAALQYSYLPSWISFLVDQSRAEDAGRTLFDVVHRYWSALPPGHRPRLVVFGESLGAFGGGAAFSGLSDLTSRTQGALFAGPPHATRLWQDLTARRNPGSPQRLPRYGDGQTVRFASTAADLRNPDGSLPPARLVFLQHPSDPVVWWSTSLIWHDPTWLSEPRGRDVVPEIRWYPLVTFWQLTADLAVAQQPPPGHGHVYGDAVPTAWAAILHPPGWTDEDTAALTRLEVRREEGASG